MGVHFGDMDLQQNMESLLTVITAKKTPSIDVKLELKREKLKLLEEKKRLQEGLPHLYGRKLYAWQRRYRNAAVTHRHRFISSANQIGKSSISITDCIDNATNEIQWKKLWGGKPGFFMYFYPSLKLATREVETKWVAEFLPRNEFKDSDTYGWELEYKAGEIKAIHFKNGVSIIFMAYSQAAIDLQASSPSAIYIDEEPPYQIMPEILMRLEGPRKGIFSMVATPTMGQMYFQEIFEHRRLPEAFAITVSMRACLVYEDGSPGPFTEADIKRREALLPTQAERDMRIEGKFVKAEGLAFPSFLASKNVKKASPVPSDWVWYSGVDVGSGGSNHPASICFVAVNVKTYQEARIVESWRGSPLEVTTTQDILKKYLQMRGSRKMHGEFYDWASKDFHITAARAGVAFQPAEKSQALGKQLLNTLFSNQMLSIDDTEQNQDLITELQNLKHDTAKRFAVDDAIDAARYAVTKIPFDFSHITGDQEKEIEQEKKHVEPRVQAMQDYENHIRDEFVNEMSLWRSLVED